MTTIPMSQGSQALSSIETRVCDAIARRAGALLDDLRLHVGLPTGGRNIEALDRSRELLVRRAVSLGAVSTTFPGELRPEWLFGETPGQAPLPTAICRRAGTGKPVLIAGHLDTVHDPAGEFRELAIASDGKTATGPGCVDMKGGLVIALAALEAIQEIGLSPSWTLLLNSDEETGSYHSQRAIFDEAVRVAKLGGTGIALEPATADGGLVVERAGSGQFLIECFGTAAHVGRDFIKGVSAVRALARDIEKALSIANPDRGWIVNVGPIQGGVATNVVPDHARAWGNVRFPTPEDAAVLAERLQTLSGTDDRGARTVIRTSFIRAAKPKTSATMRLAELARNAASALGQTLPFASTSGVCDGNIMQSAGLPTIDTLGVRGGGLHTPQEWIDLSSLVERCQLLAVTIVRASNADNLA